MLLLSNFFPKNSTLYRALDEKLQFLNEYVEPIQRKQDDLLEDEFEFIDESYEFIDNISGASSEGNN